MLISTETHSRKWIGRTSLASEESIISANFHRQMRTWRKSLKPEWNICEKSLCNFTSLIYVSMNWLRVLTDFCFHLFFTSASLSRIRKPLTRYLYTQKCKSISCESLAFPWRQMYEFFTFSDRNDAKSQHFLIFFSLYVCTCMCLCFVRIISAFLAS